MPRRPTEWHGVAYGDLTLSASPANVTVMSASDFESYTKPTVTRIIGDLTFRLNHDGTQVPTAATIICGIGVFDEDAIPNPYSELHRSGWMGVYSDLVWAPAADLINGYTGASYPREMNGFRKARFHVDIRAQRIVGPAQRLVMVTYFADELGSPDNPAVTGHLRILVKE